MPDTLPTADEFFGAGAPAPTVPPPATPAPAPQLPTADEFFGPAPDPVSLTLRHLVGLSPIGPEADDFFSRTAVGRVMDAFSVGAANGWGAEPLGLSEDSAEKFRKGGFFNDFDKNDLSLVKTFNEVLFRPAAVVLDAFVRGVIQTPLGWYQGGMAQIGTELGQPKLGKDLAIVPESIGAHLFGGVKLPTALSLAKAAELGVIGAGEHGWRTNVVPASRTAARIEGEARSAPPPAEAGATPRATPEAPAPFAVANESGSSAQAAPSMPDIHQLARQTDPEVFGQFDALTARQDKFRTWLDELAETRHQDAVANAPHNAEIAALDQQLADLKEKGGYFGKRQALEAQRAKLSEANDTAIEEALGRDTPDMAKVRHALQANDYAMRDLAPQVSAAYRRAEAMMPREEAPAAALPPAAEETKALGTPPELDPAATAEPGAAVNPPVQADLPLTAADAPAKAAAAATTPAHLDAIRADVVSQLTSAGRPLDEAQAAAEIVGERYRTRAARFDGAKGNALDLYRGTGLDVRGDTTRAPIERQPQPALYQAADIPGADGRTTRFDNDLRFWKGGIERVIDGRQAVPMRLGKRFAVLREMGIKDSGLDLDPRAANKMMADHPAVPREVWDRLPELVSDPLYAYPHKNGGIRVVLDATDKDGHPIVVGISDGRVNTVFDRWEPNETGPLQGLHEDLANALRRKQKLYSRDGMVPREVLNAVRPVVPDAAPSGAFPRAGTGGNVLSRAEVLKRQDGLFYQGEYGQGEYGQAKRGAITLKQGRAVVRLFQDANASTFMHEMGHQWLEELKRDAEDAAAPEQLRRDWDTVRGWLGVEDGANLKRGQHERWARGFEQYLYTGQAPTPGLVKAFTQFRTWLMGLYDRMRGLGKPIGADIRDVFDRLIAENPERQPVGTLREKASPPPDMPARELPTADGTPAPAPLTLDMPAGDSSPAQASLPLGLRQNPPAGPMPPTGAAKLFDTVPREPKRLIDWLREKGGLDDAGGDVAHVVGGAKSRPGLINRQSGMSLDDAARAAWEAGYFPGHTERPGINDLLAAIDDDRRGTARYSEHDTAAVERFRRAQEANREVETLAAKYNIPLTRPEFYAELSARVSVEEAASLTRSLDDAHAAELAAAEDRAKEFLDSRGEAWEPDAPKEEAAGRTLEEMEHEYRSEEAAARAPAGKGDPGQSGPARGGEGAGAEGAGLRQRGTDAGSATKPPGSATEQFERPDTGLIDKAGNIRLDNLGTPEDVSQVIRDTAEANADFLAGRRGVLSDGETFALAEALGMDPATLNQRKIGQAFNAEQILAARKLLIQSATSVRDAMARAAEGSDADVLAYAQTRTRHQMIQEQVAGITAEAGRALRAFRSLEGMDQANALGKFLEKNAGLTLYQLREEARRGAELKTPAEVSRFMADARKPSYKDMIVEYYINNLVSGPFTHAGYAIHNTLLMVSKLGETAISGIIGEARERITGQPVDRVYVGEAKAQLFGLLQGARVGLPAAWEAIKTNELQRLPGETILDAREAQTLAPRGAIPGMIGQIVRAPGRTIQGVHALTRWMAYTQELHSLAYREAAARGLEGPALQSAIARTLADPPEAMMKAASETATNLALMRRHQFGSATSALARFSNSNLAAKIVVPFVNIVANVLREGLIERSPLGLLDADVRDNLMGRNGAVARDAQAGRLIAGAMISTATASLFLNDQLTGAGPNEPNKRSMWIAAGHQPYSVKVGGHWFSYRGGPIGTLMAVTADICEIAHDADDKDMAEMAGALVVGVAKGIKDESQLRGVADLMGAIDRPDSGGNWARQMVANFAVPFSVGMGQIARAIDPNMREARTVVDAVKARIPGLSMSLPVKRDIWGEPMERHTLISRNGPYSTDADPVAKELLDLGVWPAKLPRQIRGVDLTDQQYDDFQRIAGRFAHARLQPIVTTPGWHAVPEFARREAIQKIINHSREMGRTMVMMQNPGIIQQATQDKLEALR